MSPGVKGMFLPGESATVRLLLVRKEQDQEASPKRGQTFSKHVRCNFEYLIPTDGHLLLVQICCCTALKLKIY